MKDPSSATPPTAVLGEALRDLRPVAGSYSVADPVEAGMGVGRGRVRSALAGTAIVCFFFVRCPAGDL
jgi:hypothetical protein